MVVCQHGLEGRPEDVIATHERNQRAYLHEVRRCAGPSAATSSTRRRIRTSVRTVSARLQRQGESAEAVAILVHPGPAPAHAGLARHAAVCGSRAHRLSTACPTAARRPCACRRYSTAIACRSARAISTSGSWKITRRRAPVQLHVLPRVRDAWSSTSETPITTLRWLADGAATVHGRARALRRRGHRRIGGLRVRQGAALLCPIRDRRPDRNRVLQRSAHDPRRGHLQVPAQVVALAGTVDHPLRGARPRPQASTQLRRSMTVGGS